MDFLHVPETWVTLSLLLFFGILAYFGVHRFVLGSLDRRADGIRRRIEEAGALLEAASEEVSKIERALAEAKATASKIALQAKKDAELARETALAEFRASLERKMQAAEQRIIQAQAAAQRAVRDRAVDIAVAAAREVIDTRISDSQRKEFTDRGIEQVRARLH